MRKLPALRRWPKCLLATLWLISFSASGAEAEGETDFDVQSPSVIAIRKSLAERYAILNEHFYSGVIGFTHDGMIAMREPDRLVRQVRARLELLVSEDNKDRSTMYREIARANGRPDWEQQFQSVFAERWISRAPAGWYYRDSSGHWIIKLPRGENGDAPEKMRPAAPFSGDPGQ